MAIESNGNDRLREKLLFVGHEAEVLLYLSFSEAHDVAFNVLIFLTI